MNLCDSFFSITWDSINPFYLFLYASQNKLHSQSVPRPIFVRIHALWSDTGSNGIKHCSVNVNTNRWNCLQRWSIENFLHFNTTALFIKHLTYQRGQSLIDTEMFTKIWNVCYFISGNHSVLADHGKIRQLPPADWSIKCQGSGNVNIWLVVRQWNKIFQNLASKLCFSWQSLYII